MNHPAPAAPITAAEWLISIAPKLYQLKAEALHDEHVAAWLDANYCEECERYFRRAQMGNRYTCKECYAPICADAAREERQEKHTRAAWGQS